MSKGKKTISRLCGNLNSPYVPITRTQVARMNTYGIDSYDLMPHNEVQEYLAKDLVQPIRILNPQAITTPMLLKRNSKNTGRLPETNVPTRSKSSVESKIIRASESSRRTKKHSPQSNKNAGTSLHLKESGDLREQNPSAVLTSEAIKFPLLPENKKRSECVPKANNAVRTSCRSYIMADNEIAKDTMDSVSSVGQDPRRRLNAEIRSHETQNVGRTQTRLPNTREYCGAMKHRIRNSRSLNRQPFFPILGIMWRINKQIVGFCVRIVYQLLMSLYYSRR